MNSLHWVGDSVHCRLHQYCCRCRHQILGWQVLLDKLFLAWLLLDLVKNLDWFGIRHHMPVSLGHFGFRLDRNRHRRLGFYFNLWFFECVIDALAASEILLRILTRRVFLSHLAARIAFLTMCLSGECWKRGGFRLCRFCSIIFTSLITMSPFRFRPGLVDS